MRYRKLGRWGLRVSEVGLGSWITYGGSVDDEVAIACIRRAYELGVNFFDTANVYHHGAAEEVMGKALTDFTRDSLVVATKVYFPMGDGPNDRGLSRKHVFEQLHRSLDRLGTDYVDLYQCHRYDPDTPLEETIRAMDDLIRQGKILYWGTSEWRADQIEHAVALARAAGWAQPISNQPQYNALYRRIERDVLPTTSQCGIGNVIWSPLAMGVLTGKYSDTTDVPADTRAASAERHFMDNYMRQPVLDAVQEFVAVAESAGVTPAQLALAWVLRHPGVSSVIVGATRTDHVEDNVAATTADFDTSALDRVSEILEPVAL